MSHFKFSSEAQTSLETVRIDEKVFRYAGALLKMNEHTQAAHYVKGLLMSEEHFDANGEKIFDFEEAYRHFQQAADYYGATFYAGLMAFHGVGTTEDEKKARNGFPVLKERPRDVKSAGQAAICPGRQMFFCQFPTITEKTLFHNGRHCRPLPDHAPRPPARPECRGTGVFLERRGRWIIPKTARRDALLSGTAE